MNDDFNGTPFAAGSLTGLRSFRIDKYGRLMASQLDVVWKPGENVGRCMRSYVNRKFTWNLPSLMPCSCTDCQNGSSWHMPSMSMASPAFEDEPKQQDSSHRAGKLDCTCGFYAYFDDQGNQYHDRPNVQGLVEGYGLTTCGDRGFRAEKARIVALVIKPKYERPATDSVRANYPDIPVFDRKRDALAEFPLTRPPTPTPETDADFWTRDAL